MAAGFAILVTAICVRYDLNEWLYALTRGEERFQLDELPIGTAALLAGLVWFAWRRYREAAPQARARLAQLVHENRALARENLRIQEAERKHLARELHDELGQYLNAIKLDAVSLMDNSRANRQYGEQADLTAVAQAVAIVGSVDHLHHAVRDMIASLRPVGLDELGLVAAIEHCLDQWRQRQPTTRKLGFDTAAAL